MLEILLSLAVIGLIYPMVVAYNHYSAEIDSETTEWKLLTLVFACVLTVAFFVSIILWPFMFDIVFLVVFLLMARFTILGVRGLADVDEEGTFSQKIIMTLTSLIMTVTAALILIQEYRVGIFNLI